MNTNDFDFDLSEELIAQAPVKNRVPLNSPDPRSKNRAIQDRHFDAILDELEQEILLS